MGCVSVCLCGLDRCLCGHETMQARRQSGEHGSVWGMRCLCVGHHGFRMRG